jgi:flagellar biosynthesis/type III secretory pathway chaperone
MSENTETPAQDFHPCDAPNRKIKQLESEFERLREENAKVTQCLDTALDREAKALNERDTAQKCVAEMRAVLQQVFDCAHPHPIHHPAMFKAWEAVESALKGNASSIAAEWVRLSDVKRERDAVMNQADSAIRECQEVKIEADKLRGELRDALLGWDEVEQLTKRLRDAGYHNGMDVTPITLDEQITKLLADLERVTRERDEEKRPKGYGDGRSQKR